MSSTCTKQPETPKKLPVSNGYSPNSSSYGHSSSPLNLRRSSFLSESMMHEVHNSFVSGVAEDGSAKYSLSVKESQGYQWNPSLFAPHYTKYDYDDSEFNGPNCPEVQEIIVDESEDIFPSDY
jgi:hypothetical protein